jgi:hypothetical protein
MKNYNASRPTEGPLTTTFSIGWEHDVVDDSVVLRRDDEGNPIPRSYTVPSRITTRRLLDAVDTIGQERLQQLAAGNVVEAVVELVGAVIGADLVIALASDPTVETDAFFELVTDLALELGLDEVVPEARPTEAPSGA